MGVVKKLGGVRGVNVINMTFGLFGAVAVVETDDIKGIVTILANEIQPIPSILETATCLAVDV
jgi:hypothetical protein